MRLLSTIVDFVPDVPTATARMLSTGAVRNAKEREMLLAFLRELKAIMTDASDSLGDPEASLARRIINGARAGSRASMQRIRRLDEAERAFGQPLGRELAATLCLSYHKMRPTPTAKARP